MASRTTKLVVEFTAPFLLPGFGSPQPAGSYRVDQDEESIEGAEWSGWRRAGAFLHLPAIGASGTRHEMAPISPADLDAALAKDLAGAHKGPQK